jgi:hypothetical protein
MRHLVCCVLALTGVGAGQNWTIGILAARGGSCAIDTDSTCRPHVAFGAAAGWGYAVRTDDSWAVAYPQTERLVLEIELCLDENGLPHIGYIEGRYTPPYLDSVRYARFDGDTWHFETVTGPARHDALSMVLARDKTPHMAFREDFVDSAVTKYACKASDTWSILTVPTEQTDTLRYLRGFSLALDKADQPGVAVAWCRPAGQDDSVWLAVFEYDGQDWHRFDVDSAPGWAPWDFWWPRVQHDPASDLFHVAYRASAYRGVYVTGRGNLWRVEEDLPVSVGNQVYDFVLHEGRPHVVGANVRYPLVYQWRWAGGWEEELVLVELVSDLSLAVDRNGLPHVAIAALDGDLLYGRRLFVGIQEPVRPASPSASRLPTITREVLVWSTTTLSLRNAGDIALQSGAKLLDATGRVVMDLQLGPNDIRHVAPGVYFVRLADSGGRTAVRKVVVQR